MTDTSWCGVSLCWVSSRVAATQQISFSGRQSDQTPLLIVATLNSRRDANERLNSWLCRTYLVHSPVSDSLSCVATTIPGERGENVTRFVHGSHPQLWSAARSQFERIEADWCSAFSRQRHADILFASFKVFFFSDALAKSFFSHTATKRFDVGGKENWLSREQMVSRFLWHSIRMRVGNHRSANFHFHSFKGNRSTSSLASFYSLIIHGFDFSNPNVSTIRNLLLSDVRRSRVTGRRSVPSVNGDI